MVVKVTLKIKPRWGCFSSDSTVREKNQGVVQMKDLRPGQLSATVHGWSTVLTQIHWHPNATIPATEITHATGVLTLTPDHFLFAQKRSSTASTIVPARDLAPGDALLARGCSAQFWTSHVVQAVRNTTMHGYYAPLTDSGSILVNGVAASCYAQGETRNVPHWLMHLGMKPLRMVPHWLLAMPPAGTVHRYAQLLSFLAEVFGA